MEKLFSLKRWLTLSEAARYVALLTGEVEVPERDLLHLALENRLELSVVFPDEVLACLLTPIADEDIEYKEVAMLSGTGTLKIPVGGPIFYGPSGQAMQKQERGKVFALETEEPYQLSMMGGERGDVLQRFYGLTGTSREETTDLDGTFVSQGRGRDARYFVLQGRLPRKQGEAPSFYPLGALPANALLVVTQQALRALVGALSGRGDVPETSSAVASRPAGPTSMWPWGAHHTELLQHLDEAARRFWVNFDPSDNTTAPKNEVVSAWLQSKGVSKRMADSMASILRADGLPTGPRT